MVEISKNWEEFKHTIESKGLRLQYYEEGNSYRLLAADGLFIYSCEIYKGGVSDDLTDFETNHKDQANQKIITPVRIGNGLEDVSIIDDNGTLRIAVAASFTQSSIGIADWLGSEGPTVGQKTMVNSLPVTLASDQTALPFSNANLDVALSTVATEATLSTVNAKLVDGTVIGDVNAAQKGTWSVGTTTWLGSTAPTVGQKTMSSSIPITFASDQSTLPVNANIIGGSDEESIGIHSGRAFTMHVPYTLLPANGTYTVSVTTDGTSLHLRDVSCNLLKNSASGYMLARVSEGATVTGGATVIPFNNLRSSLNTTASVWKTAPSVVSSGTLLYEYLLHTDRETYLSPSYTSAYEIILKPTTTYLIQIINNTNKSLGFTAMIFFYTVV